VLQISQMFKPEKDDVEYAQGRYMLQMLGLQVRRCAGAVLFPSGFAFWVCA
jgi:hypothetical protein